MKFEIPKRFPDYAGYAQEIFRKWLEMLGFPVTSPLFINGHHNKENEDKSDEWEYKASYTKDEQCNVFLRCEARFTAEIGEKFDISIPIPESEINK